MPQHGHQPDGRAFSRSALMRRKVSMTARPSATDARSEYREVPSSRSLHPPPRTSSAVTFLSLQGRPRAEDRAARGIVHCAKVDAPDLVAQHKSGSPDLENVRPVAAMHHTECWRVSTQDGQPGEAHHRLHTPRQYMITPVQASRVSTFARSSKRRLFATASSAACLKGTEPAS